MKLLIPLLALALSSILGTAAIAGGGLPDHCWQKADNGNYFFHNGQCFDLIRAARIGTRTGAEEVRMAWAEYLAANPGATQAELNSIQSQLKDQ